MSKEQRNKGPKKKVNPPKPVVREPVFLYLSACCSVKAIKQALVKTSDAEGTLGTWRCSGCGKACVCGRMKAKPDAQKAEDSIQAAAQ